MTATAERGPRRCPSPRCDDPDHYGCDAGERSPDTCPLFMASHDAARDGGRSSATERATSAFHEIGGNVLEGDDSPSGRADGVTSAAWVQGGETTPGDDDAERPGSSSDVIVPWTGNALGSRALEFVAGAAPLRMVAVVGASDSGKSTLLAYLYTLLGRGRPLSAGAFAGSYTLQAWENLGADLRFTSWDTPRFPPHTPAGAGRVPGLLHLALAPAPARDDASASAKGRVHVVLTDAPGEWFTRWAEAPDTERAAGARWIAAHATAFLVLADQEVLAGPASEMGPALAALQRLVERVRAAAAGRPVGIVWNKADVVLPAARQQRIDSALAAVGGGLPQFRASVCPLPGDANPDAAVLNLFGWACGHEPRRGVSLPPLDAAWPVVPDELESALDDAADLDQQRDDAPQDDADGPVEAGRARRSSREDYYDALLATVALGQSFLTYRRL